jgi:hypothetical protein
VAGALAQQVDQLDALLGTAATDARALASQLRELLPDPGQAGALINSTLDKLLPELPPARLGALDLAVRRFDNASSQVSARLEALLGPIEQRLLATGEQLEQLQGSVAQLAKLQLEEALLNLPRPGSVTLGLVDRDGATALQVGRACVAARSRRWPGTDRIPRA